MLVSSNMIAQAHSNRWSELLTFVLTVVADESDRQGAPTGCLVSNPAQNRGSSRVMVKQSELEPNARSSLGALRCPLFGGTVSLKGESSEGKSMEPVLPPFHTPFRRRLAFFTDLLTKLIVRLKSRPRDFGSQRMCPFCGLITSRSKRLCLECGKSLTGVQLGRKDARQE